MRAPEHRSPAIVVPKPGSAAADPMPTLRPDGWLAHSLRPTGRAVAARRILLLRSGRHLRVAMDSLAARYPGCRVGVVGTPGSQPAIEQAGIAPEDRFFHDVARFQPASFFFSHVAWAVRRWRYDQVAILWNDPDGHGQGNVDRTALAISPRGYLAVTPDGTIVERALWPQVRMEAMRAVMSLAVGAVLGIFLYGPAIVMKVVRQAFAWRPVKERPTVGDVASREGAPHEFGSALDGRRTGLHGPSEIETLERPVVVPFKRPEIHR